MESSHHNYNDPSVITVAVYVTIVLWIEITIRNILSSS